MEQLSDSPSGCCPRFKPDGWDGTEHLWQDRLFIKDRIRCFLHMPINFGKVITRLVGLVEKGGGAVADNLCLSDHTSKWNMDIYLAVDKNIPGADNIRLSGKFLTKVYEGPYKNTGAWCEDFKTFVAAKGLDIKKWYMWYTTCPKCAKFYGKNYVVVVGKIE
jgi:hypothetical protein